MKLNKRQLIAIRNPCFDAEDCNDDHFYWRPIDSFVSIGMTLNVGME